MERRLWMSALAVALGAMVGIALAWYFQSHSEYVQGCAAGGNLGDCSPQQPVGDVTVLGVLIGAVAGASLAWLARWVWLKRREL
jgi:hypothetical protein